ANFTRGVAAVSRALEARLRRWGRGGPGGVGADGVAPPPPGTARERAARRGRVCGGAVWVAGGGGASPGEGDRGVGEAAAGAARRDTADRGRRSAPRRAGTDGVVRRAVSRLRRGDARGVRGRGRGGAAVADRGAAARRARGDVARTVRDRQRGRRAARAA